MKVYVVILEEYHEGSDLRDVFDSLEKAKAAYPDEVWHEEGFYIDNREGCVAYGDEHKGGYTYVIQEREVL